MHLKNGMDKTRCNHVSHPLLTKEKKACRSYLVFTDPRYARVSIRSKPQI